MLKGFLNLFPYFVLCAAVALVWRELRDIDWRAFALVLTGFPTFKLVLALVALAADYTVMSLYDRLALRQLGERLPPRQVLFTSLQAFSISNLVGHSMITGLAMRVREYGRFGVRLSKVAQIMIMNVESWWIGFFFLAGCVLVNVPNERILAYSAYLTSGAGALLLGITGIYLLACWAMSGGRLRLGRFEIFLPDLETGIMKVLTGACDTLLLSLTLYILLPPNLHIPFSEFVSLHLTAHFLGVVTMVPGGLGVVEGVLLKLLEPYGDRAAIFASLMLFRMVHYVLPAALTLMTAALRGRPGGEWRIMRRPGFFR